MYNNGPILRPFLLRPSTISHAEIQIRTSARAAVLHAAATTGTRRSAEVEAVSKVLLDKCCIAVSLKRSAWFLKWNNEPLRRATPAGIPLAQPALVFISVRRGESSGEPPASLPVSGICTPQRSCALSCGCSLFVRQVDTTRILMALQVQKLHRYMCICSLHTQTRRLKRKSRRH